MMLCQPARCRRPVDPARIQDGVGIPQSLNYEVMTRPVGNPAVQWCESYRRISFQDEGVAVSEENETHVTIR